jgi:hypothetical protein
MTCMYYAAPDVIGRRTDDLTPAGRFRDEGMAGFVLVPLHPDQRAGGRRPQVRPEPM